MSPTKGTPTHSVRIDPDLWDTAGRKLDEQEQPVQVTFTVDPGSTRSDLFKASLSAYVEEA